MATAIKNKTLIPSDPIIIHLLGIHHREILLQLPKDVSVKGCLQEYLLQGRLEGTQMCINSNWLRKCGSGIQYNTMEPFLKRLKRLLFTDRHGKISKTYCKVEYSTLQSGEYNFICVK